MSEPGYKQLISYKLSQIAFILGWEFVPKYYHRIEDSRQRDQIKQALRSFKQNIVEGSAKRSLSRKLNLYDVAKSSRMEALEDFEVEEKHQKEGGYNEKLFKKRLEYIKDKWAKSLISSINSFHSL